MRINPLDKMLLGGAVDLSQLTLIVKDLVHKVDKLEKCMKIDCDSCDCEENPDERPNATNRPKNGGRTRKDVSSS